MLEHPSGPESAQTPQEPPEEPFYTPAQKPEALNGQSKAPTVKRYSRKMIVGMTVMGGAVVTLAFWAGLRQSKPQPIEAVVAAAPAPLPAAPVTALPDTYGDVPILGDPRPGDVGAMASADAGSQPNGPARPPTPVQQYAQQVELDRLRNEDRARSAAVSFATGSSEGATATPAAAADPSGLQDRLLELAQHPGAAGTPAASPANTRDDANRQDDKTQFVSQSRDTDFQLHAAVERPRSPYTLFAGSLLPCVLTQGINSDLPGQLGCMISANVYDTVTGRYLLLPQGTKAIGTYDSRVAYGQNRVLVVWTRLLRPDGTTLSLEGMPGTDLSGYAGLTGHVNNHYARLLTGVVLGSLLGAGAQLAVGANAQNPNFSQLAVQGVGQNINEAGQQITRKNLNIQPTIEVPPGGRLNIVATRDLILPPWTD